MHILLALSVVFWKYLGLMLLIVFSFVFFWNFWYHVICLVHKLWLEQARTCKWLASDMILLKQPSKNLSCSIFILQSSSQVLLISFDHNSSYRWDHTRLALSVVVWKYLRVILLILSLEMCVTMLFVYLTSRG